MSTKINTSNTPLSSTSSRVSEKRDKRKDEKDINKELIELTKKANEAGFGLSYGKYVSKYNL